MTERVYQTRAESAVLGELASGARSVCLVAPTGAGKTRMGANVVRALTSNGARVLWIAHRHELVQQAIGAMGIPVGVIQAGAPSGTGQCIVAQLQTLVRREVPAVDVVIIDEAHRSLAKSYTAILDQVPLADVIGLTATPCRLDGKGLGEVFNRLIVAARTSDLIRDGYLMRPTVYVAPVEPDLKGVHKQGGDYKADELEAAVNKPALRGDVVRHWLERSAGKPTVCFAVSVAHSRALVEDFAAQGVTAVHVDGDTSPERRGEALAMIRDGRAQVLCNVGIVTEGWDFPELHTCILARPTASLSLLMQMWGRIMRPAPGKTGALVLDHSSNVMRHGVLPWTDVEWTLESSKRPTVASGVVNCPQCYVLQMKDNDVCEGCGAKLAKPRVKTKKEQGEIITDATTALVEYDTAVARSVLTWLERVKQRECSPYVLRLMERYRLGTKHKNPLPADFDRYVLAAKGDLGKAAWLFKVKHCGRWV